MQHILHSIYSTEYCTTYFVQYGSYISYSVKYVQNTAYFVHCVQCAAYFVQYVQDMAYFDRIRPGKERKTVYCSIKVWAPLKNLET
jgi:hypothetical protein